MALAFSHPHTRIVLSRLMAFLPSCWKKRYGLTTFRKVDMDG